MVHMSNAITFDMREVTIAAQGLSRPSPALYWTILLDYSDVDSGLVFLDALPHNWTIDDTRTTLTNVKMAPVDQYRIFVLA